MKGRNREKSQERFKPHAGDQHGQVRPDAGETRVTDGELPRHAENKIQRNRQRNGDADILQKLVAVFAQREVDMKEREEGQERGWRQVRDREPLGERRARGGGMCGGGGESAGGGRRRECGRYLKSGGGRRPWGRG